ncbi:MAG: carboxylating nicotinate-nucleotide diphosphorylase [Mariprofundaceae bacterium]|nr:carboxylating nicotinate-nucleotide diphosphorylase [Mariprofundaceae bacterium]
MGSVNMDAYMDALIKQALAEDAVETDLTTQATIMPGQSGTATITAKAKGCLSGAHIVRRVFESVDTGITQEWAKQDADSVRCGTMICRVSGALRSLLAAERTALNFLQHLSGVATATRAFVDAVAGTGCAIADTRKTTPGLRQLEKQAVVHGSGINHRMDLASGMLIKENHIAAAGSIANAVNLCSGAGRHVWIEVECETMDEVREAIRVEPDMILLDNMTPESVRAARAIAPTSILLEASGNITVENARDYAETGVDRLAIGAITHSAPALDMTMLVRES